MDENAYYNIYILVTVGAAIVGISLYLLRTGESYIKRYFNIGGDYSQSSNTLVSVFAEIVASFFLAGIVYVMLFNRHNKNSMNSSIPQGLSQFAFWISLFWLFELRIVNKFDNLAKWIINNPTTKRLSILLRIFSHIIVVLPVCSYTFGVLKLNEIQISKDVNYFLIVVFLVLLGTYITTLILVGMLKSIKTVSEAEEHELIFNDGKTEKLKVLVYEKDFFCVKDALNNIKFINKESVKEIRK